MASHSPGGAHIAALQREQRRLNKVAGQFRWASVDVSGLRRWCQHRAVQLAKLKKQVQVLTAVVRLLLV